MRTELNEFAIQKIEFILPLLIKEREALKEDYNQLTTILDKIFEILKKEKNSDSKKLKPLKDMVDIYFYKNTFNSAIKEDFLYLYNRQNDEIAFFTDLLSALNQEKFEDAKEIITKNKNTICSSITNNLPAENKIDDIFKRLKDKISNDRNKDLTPVQKELKALINKISLINRSTKKKTNDRYDYYITSLKDEISFFLTKNKPRLKSLELKCFYGKKYKKEKESIIIASFNDSIENEIRLSMQDNQADLFKFFEFLIFHEGEFVNYTRLLDVQIDVVNAIESQISPNSKSKKTDWKKIEVKTTERAWQLQKKLHDHFMDFLYIYFIDSATYFKQKSAKIGKNFNYHSKYELKAYRLKMPNEIFEKNYAKEKISFICKFN